LAGDVSRDADPDCCDAQEFDPVWYLARYADVRAAGLDPWEHYRSIGRSEGRLPAPVQALTLEQLLWEGGEDEALPQLERLFATGALREQALAGWVLARWHAAQGSWSRARDAIARFHRLAEGALVIRHPGPWLLGVQARLATGDIAGAEACLDDAHARFAARPDFDLARMLVLRARGAEETTISALLGEIHPPRDLTPLSLAVGPGPRFDRLQAEPAPVSEADDDAPLVSVIVPVFNSAGVLGTALRGLVAQSWRNLEILVVDDGSSDGSVAVAQDWAARDARIRVLPQEANRGAYPARNAGLAAARGTFVTVHDADDWSHPEKIRAQLRVLIEDPALMASVSHWVRADDDLQMTLWRMDQGWVYRNVSSLMLRIELRETLGFWDRVRVNADTEYYYRIIAAYGPGAIREVFPGVPLAFGRTSAGSLTMRSETHLRSQFNGLRRDYMEAAQYWHATAARTGIEALFLPEHPAQRPFRVPAALGIGDPEGPESDFDLIAASPLLDAAWYRRAYPDVLMAGIGPARHQALGGGREDRDPGPAFSSGGYRLAEDLGPDEVPLAEFERAGRARGAAPLPRFEGRLIASDPVDRPRVMVFAHSLGKTLFGAERSLLGVLERMERRGFAPVVVVPGLRNRPYLDKLLEISVAVECLPQIWRRGHRVPPEETVAAIRALIRSWQPMAVHVNTLVLDAPLVAARAEGVESIVHVRELPEEDASLRHGLGLSAPDLRRQLLDQADRFIANSDVVARWLDCPERVKVRPNSVSERLFALPYAPPEVLRVAMISSNIAKKGVADFIQLARRVEAAGRPMRFLLIGPASRDLHELRPWPGNVEFRDYAASPVEAVAQADVVVSLSKFAESFGRTVMEAMAAGRPVICYDRGAPPTLVQSGQTGFVVPADDIEGVANAVLALDAARSQLPRLSAAARRRARVLQDRAYLS